MLDLDETLIHCAKSADSYLELALVHDLSLSNLQISFRPGLKNFLTQCTQLFEIIIFTASDGIYA